MFRVILFFGEGGFALDSFRRSPDVSIFGEVCSYAVFLDAGFLYCIAHVLR